MPRIWRVAITQVGIGTVPHASAFADEIRNDPVLLALLERLETKGQQLTTAQAAANQHGEHGRCPVTPRPHRVRAVPPNFFGAHGVQSITVNVRTLRVVAVTVAGILAPFVAVFAGAQVEWPPASVFGPTQNERPAIIDAALRAGLSDPVRARVLMPQFGCRGVALESERRYDGSRRTWRWVYLQDDTPSGDCIAHKFRSGWRARGRVSDATEWLVERGRVRAWITLNEYMTGTGRHYTISYDDARQVVLAFIDSRVVDRRRPGNRVPSDPPLPVGPDAQQIDAVASRDHGWEVFANGWTFYVEPGADRLVVTDSSYPIP